MLLVGLHSLRRNHPDLRHEVELLPLREDHLAGAAGRASLYVTTLATMMGLHIRVGTEDTPWKFPHRDEHVDDNLAMFRMAREIASLHGREPASANEYRKMIGKPER
ncbi:MAG: 3-keto-5-aminohexanoate cleavage protein [Pigmentiphaga sp.]